MDHPEGAGSERGDRVDFDPRVRLEFRGTQLSSDGGLLVMREPERELLGKTGDFLHGAPAVPFPS